MFAVLTAQIVTIFSLVPVPPTDILMSSVIYQSPTTQNNTVVGRISAVDGNVLDTFTYSIVGGKNSTLFTILSGDQLALRHAGQFGDPLEVLLQATDNTARSVQKLISVYQGNAIAFLHLLW